MSVEENKKSFYRCFDEIWNKRDSSAIPELISPDYVGVSFQGEVRGLEGFQQMVKNQLTSMPDLQYKVDEVFGEEDKVMGHITITGTQAAGKLGNYDISGKKVNYTFVLINRYVDGKCIESTGYGNPLDLLQQLGVPLPSEWGMG